MGPPGLYADLTLTKTYKWKKTYTDVTRWNYTQHDIVVLEVFITSNKLFTLVTEILMLVTKSESSWASWPQDFLQKVEPWFCNSCEKQTIKMISTQHPSLICHENVACVALKQAFPNEANEIRAERKRFSHSGRAKSGARAKRWKDRGGGGERR